MGKLFCFVPQNDRDGRHLWHSIPIVTPSEDSSTNVEVLEYIHARIGVLTCQDWPLGRESWEKLREELPAP